MSSLLIIFMFVIFKFKIMASFSPLVTNFNQNKLIGSNYIDWKRNLDIFLTTEGHKYVLTQPCPNFLKARKCVKTQELFRPQIKITAQLILL